MVGVLTIERLDEQCLGTPGWGTLHISFTLTYTILEEQKRLVLLGHQIMKIYISIHSLVSRTNKSGGCQCEAVAEV